MNRFANAFLFAIGAILGFILTSALVRGDEWRTLDVQGSMHGNEFVWHTMRQHKCPAPASTLPAYALNGVTLNTAAAPIAGEVRGTAKAFAGELAEDIEQRRKCPPNKPCPDEPEPDRRRDREPEIPEFPKLPEIQWHLIGLAALMLTLSFGVLFAVLIVGMVRRKP
jgi:hypothetical protein